MRRRLPTAEELLSRRQVLTLFGATGLAVVAAACSDGASSTDRAGRSASTTTGAGASADVVAGTTVDCVLTPEMTEGPYYLDDQLVRRDITEGRAGIPLRLELTVADASTCEAIPGALVEIWHADAEGAYSGFGTGGSDTTFLRGGQHADETGTAVFQTIYPGWYRGRAVHIHVKVHEGTTVHTTQLFFDQRLTDDVFTRSPYRGNSGGTTNEQDGIYSAGGAATVLTMTPANEGHIGTIVLGIQR